METLAFAIRKERAMAARYRTLSRESPTRELKEAFDLLADEEAKHVVMLQRVQTAMAGWDESAFLEEHHKAIEQAAGRIGEAAAAKSLLDAYQEALARERESEAFYKQAALKETAGHLRGTFYFLEGMERDHAKLVERVIRLVSRADVFVDPGKKPARE
ncbi:MAG: ferritin family protein [Elusimicrobiota bacterium]